MKISVPLIAMVFACVSLPAAADDAFAREIMQKVEDRDDGDNRTSNMRMVLIDKRGRQRTRVIESYAKDFGEDTYRLMFFQEPADVQGTGFLTYDYDDEAKDDDQWLYLPALRKSKRIASQDKSGSFMGSDFNYSDMTSRKLRDFDFQVQKEMALGEHTVWVIEAAPRSEGVVDETGYKKSLLLVRQDNYVVVRAVHWTAEGNKQRFYDIPELALIEGVWTPLEVTMTTKQGGQTVHRTVLTFSDVRFNQDLDESLFTVRSLERES